MAVPEERTQAGPPHSLPGRSADLFGDPAALTVDAQEHPVSVAEKIIGAILQLAPRMQRTRRASVAGAEKQGSLRGIRVGIIGPHATHCALADRLRAAFSMAITCYCGETEEQRRASEFGYHLADDIDTLLSMADVVVAVDPCGKATDFRVDNEALNAMQPHAVLITDVAAVPVDQFPLAHALWFETIAGAGFVRSSAASRLLPQVEMAHKVVLV